MVVGGPVKDFKKLGRLHLMQQLAHFAAQGKLTAK
jgi:hypothetical protein